MNCEVRSDGGVTSAFAGWELVNVSNLNTYHSDELSFCGTTNDEIHEKDAKFQTFRKSLDFIKKMRGLVFGWKTLRLILLSAYVFVQGSKFQAMRLRIFE